MSGPAVDRTWCLDTLSELIRIDSTNPSLVAGGAGEAAIAARLGAMMRDIGVDEISRQDLGGGRVNVIGVLRGAGGGRSLMLNGHTDVVSPAGMLVAPFAPAFKDGRVYGRGACDMKGGLTAMLAAVRAIAAGERPRGDVIIACVADEEYASIGSEAVVRAYHADAGIVCEPTGLALCVAHKGFAWETVRVSGRAAHGSDYESGVDAIVKAGAFLTAVARHNRDVLMRRSHPLLGSPSCHASLISGGGELSTYPASCEIKLERRTLPDETRESVVAELDDLLRGVAAADPDFVATGEVFFYRPALEVSPDEPVAAALSAAVSGLTGQRPEITGAFGWLDSAIMAGAGIPTIIFGPDGYGAHGAEEWVSLQSVVDCAAALAGAIAAFCG